MEYIGGGGGGGGDYHKKGTNHILYSYLDLPCSALLVRHDVLQILQ